MKYLSHYMEQAQSKAFKLYGAFFAFGNEQFKEKANPEITYISMGAGLICPKIWAKDLNQELKNIQLSAIKLDIEENGINGIIEREYFNHETQLTGDNSDLMRALKPYIKLYPGKFTNEIIQEVCKACFNKAVENDLF